MLFRPIFDKIIVKAIEAKDQYEGLYVPDVARKSTKSGTVVAVPNGSESYCPQVKVGDIVFYDEYRMTKVYVDDQELLVMREENVHFIVESNQN